MQAARFPLLLTICAASASGVLAAEPDGRIDIDVMQPSGATLRAEDGSTAKSLRWTFPLTDEWLRREYRFTPEADATVRIRLKSRHAGLEHPVWAMYDGLDAEGCAVRNGDFETMPSSKTGWRMEKQVKGKGAQWLSSSTLAAQGKGCVQVWHNGPATQDGVAVRAGVPVRLSVWARAALEPIPAPDPAAAAAFGPFDFSSEALRVRYPESGCVDRIVRAMASADPLAPRVGEYRGRRALWLNGDWHIAPMPAPPEAIAGRVHFVPSILAKSFSLQESYAPPETDLCEADRLWYSVNVEVPEEWRGAPLRLRFGVVDFVGAVYLNGRHAGTHAGRFTPFEVPVAPEDVAGGTLNISVFVLKCDAAIADGVSWFQLGSSYRSNPLPGGISAPVCLYRENEGRVRLAKIETRLAPNRLSVRCECGGPEADIMVEPVVLDAGGLEVLRLGSKPAAAALAWEIPWKDPHLWSPDDPYLYRMRFECRRAGNGEVLPDSLEETFGFREVRIENARILVNGVPVRMFGVSVGVQSNAAWCRADEEFNYLFFRILRERLGINALRFHHTPAFEAQIRAADRAGMLVINQSGVWTSARDFTYRGGEDSLRNLRREFGEWIRRDWNSPSTIIWDVANEYIAGSPGYADYWRKLDAIAREWDATRIVQQSASGPYDPRGETWHQHTGYYSNARANRGVPALAAAAGQPMIFGEFLSPKDIEPLRFFRDERDINAAYIKTFEDRLAEYRNAGASGIFPFYSMEDAFTLDPKLPEGLAFAPESFSPKRLHESYIVNPYANVAAQTDPAFEALARRVFAPVAAIWRERSHVFRAGMSASRTLRVANDSALPVRGRLVVTHTPARGGAAREILVQDVALAPGESRDVAAVLPADLPEGAGTLSTRLDYGAGSYADDKPCSVLPAPRLAAPAKVSLFGGGDALAAALRAMGCEVRRLAGLDSWDGASVLVVGENAVTEPGAMRTLLDRGRGSIIVLRQDDAEFSDMLALGYERAPGEPGDDARLAQAGLYAPVQDEALHAAGIEDYDSPGGLDAAYFDTYAVPLHDSVLPPDMDILFGGQRPHHAPCVRHALAEGNHVFCQMPLEGHLGDDGRAAPILARLVDVAREERPAPTDGSVYAADPALRARLAVRGFRLADSPTDAALAVADAADYARDAALQAVPNALLCGVGPEPVMLDGRRAKANASTGFITFAVLPGIPGFGHLSPANFARIADGTINKEGGFKLPVPVLGVERSRRAVVGRRTSTRMRVYPPKGGMTVFAFYETPAGGRRWVCGFPASESFVESAALSIARELRLPFALGKARLVQDYYAIGAGNVTLDGDLGEWTFEGDQTLHAKRNAARLRFGNGVVFRAMEDADNLYLSIEASTVKRFLLEGRGLEVVALPVDGGALAVSVNGEAAAGRGVWRMAAGRAVLEMAVPHARLGAKSALRVAYGAATHPAEPGATFHFRMRQARYAGDFPGGGEVTGSGATKLEVHVGTAEKIPAAPTDAVKRAERVRITESPGKGWKIQFLTCNDRKPIAKGDLVLGVAHVRAVGKEASMRSLFRLGQTQNRIADVAMETRGDGWHRFYARARANRDYAVGQCVISLELGALAPGDYEFGDMAIVNYGAVADPESLPADGEH